MNWDQVEGNWKLLAGKIRERWGRLTDDELTQIGGKWDQFVGRLQDAYGVTKEEAERQLQEWLDELSSREERARTRGTAYGARWDHSVEGDLQAGVTSLQRCVQEKPMSSLATALGVGFLLGLILRRH